MHEGLGELSNDAADVRRVFGFEVQVVDEDDQDASRLARVGGTSRRRQHDAFGHNHLGRGLQQVEGPAAVDEHERLDLLFDAVFENHEIVLGEVGHETAVRVPGNGVGGDQGDAGPEGGLIGPLGRRRRLGREQGAGRAQGHQSNCGTHRRIIGASSAGGRAWPAARH